MNSGKPKSIEIFPPDASGLAASNFLEEDFAGVKHFSSAEWALYDQMKSEAFVNNGRHICHVAQAQ